MKKGVQLTLLGLLSMSFFFSVVPQVFAEWELAGSNSLAGTTNVALPITDLQITGSGTEPIPVKLVVTSGTLAMSQTTGLTFTGGTSGSTLQFSGTQANVNAALATLTYTRSGTGSDTLEVSLVRPGEVFFEENGHLYEYISDAGTWNAAKPKAEALTRYGATGYLATILSSAENAFVTARLLGAGWMGASDSESEGTWKWVTGPETGTSFWSGTAGGSTIGGNYANWGSGEPNQSGEEDCGQFLAGGTGKWNDLPCGSSSLAGYVAEFGASGALPTVVAKNITITTSALPVVSTLSPADNATGVAINANLVITFSKTVSTSTGEIAIRKVSDDSLVESIAVTGGLISGSGSNTITINPSTTLAESTAYYVTIPNTAFKDSLDNFYTGTAASTTWNFTTGDFTAPALSAITATSTATTSVISWITAENASTKVVFGLTTAYGTTTPETNTSSRVTSHEVTLTGLVRCATYHYAVVSRDASSNAATSTDSTLRTTGCTAESAPTTATSTAITTSSGGSSQLTENSTTITVDAPADFTDESSSVVIQVQAIAGDTILASLGRPQSVPREVGTIVFDVKAIIDNTTVLDSFDSPVTITYQYADADTAGLDEPTFWLYHYHDDAWEALDSCTINTDTNTISCTTPNFSIFGLFGQALAADSSRTHSSTRVGCKDVAAQNYDAFVSHRQDLCVYKASATQAQTSAFTRDLTLGSVGEDVQRLQVYLNNHGFTLAATGLGSPQNETTTFGALTRDALSKFQIAKGITPAVGYFGPLTRSSILDMVTTPIVQNTTSALRDLEMGMNGEDVRKLQDFLISKSFTIAAGATGYFGSQTKDALIAYQKASAISPAAGYFGAQTRAYILQTNKESAWW